MRLTRRGALAAPALLWATRARAETEVTFALSSNSFGSVGVRLADHAGLFAKHDLKARFVVMDSGNAATSALISRSTTFAVSGPGEVLTARARRQPVVILANTYRGLAASVVLSTAVARKSGVAPDAPIEQRLKVLDGLSVAEPSATSAYVAPVRNSAAEVGATIKLVYMAQPAMPAALEAGAVQAMVASAPFWGAAVLKGLGVVWISGPGGDLPPKFAPTSTSCVQATADYARANPDIVRRVQTVVRELGVLLRQDPEQGKAILGKAYPQLDAQSLVLAFQKESPAWSQPLFSDDDIRHEIDLLKANGGAIPGLDRIDPRDVLEFQA